MSTPILMAFPSTKYFAFVVVVILVALQVQEVSSQLTVTVGGSSETEKGASLNLTCDFDHADETQIFSMIWETSRDNVTERYDEKGNKLTKVILTREPDGSFTGSDPRITSSRLNNGTFLFSVSNTTYSDELRYWCVPTSTVFAGGNGNQAVQVSVPQTPYIHVAGQSCVASPCTVQTGENITCSIDAYRPNTSLSMTFSGEGSPGDTPTTNDSLVNGYIFYTSSLNITATSVGENKYSCRVKTKAFSRNSETVTITVTDPDARGPLEKGIVIAICVVVIALVSVVVIGIIAVTCHIKKKRASKPDSNQEAGSDDDTPLNKPTNPTTQIEPESSSYRKIHTESLPKEGSPESLSKEGISGIPSKESKSITQSKESKPGSLSKKSNSASPPKENKNSPPNEKSGSPSNETSGNSPKEKKPEKTTK